ncbi:MAG TPA: ABC transporter permease subunit [Gemmatimonadales bacterium]|nr:ABC transporter permease subunit [Gemmatimonadales bacterium]
MSLPSERRPLRLADLVVLGLVGAAVAAIVSFAAEFRAPYIPAIRIDLAPAALPRYVLYSLIRGVAALLISYLFAFGFGLAAASSRAAERLLLPLLDILQSIPVLGFLPGLVLGLVALFPGRNTGLELAAILMIFTAQAWNLALSFYQSLVTVPEPMREACRLAGWRRWQVFRRLEVPAAMQGLVWNGMLSMAGGWFFLMVNEAFRLGNHDFRLPGVGSYMSVAVERGDRGAMTLAILAMIVMIVAVDRLFWRPLVVWTERFRLDDSSGELPATNWLVELLRRSRWRRRAREIRRLAITTARRVTRPIHMPFRMAPLAGTSVRPAGVAIRKGLVVLLVAGLAAGAAWGSWRLARLMTALAPADWLAILRAAAYTFARVIGALVLGTAWALPAGILIGRSPRLARLCQPVIQIVASFPAPMLFPIVVLGLAAIGMGLGSAAVVLLVLSSQWYILFNVIAAVAGTPPQLTEAVMVFGVRGAQRWRSLYLPAAFPGLVTGWITAAGGAWNGSIVAEYLHAGGALRTTEGLGSLISEATAQANFPLLAGGVALMSVIVVGWNRLVWRRIAHVAQTKYGTTQ